jgi:PadR family transcriptional regulator, regulatory protein PadR
VEFTKASYFVLAALADGPLHGYAIIGRAAELSSGSVRLSTGTLYGVLDRATGEGLLVAGKAYVEGGRTRRDYALTLPGRRALLAEADSLVRAGRSVSRRLRAADASAAVTAL